MSHEWDRGVMKKPSWHMLEKIQEMLTAQEMIEAGEKCGAWPVHLFNAPIQSVYQFNGQTVTLPIANDQAVIAEYADSIAHPNRVVGINRDRYRITDPREWRALVSAACDAGAKPDGAFALHEGRRVVACFEVCSDEAGAAGPIKSHLLLCDSFDGTLRLTCGLTSTRVVCQNTLSMALRADGKGMARIRHTASADEKIKDLLKAVELAVKHGHAVAHTMAKAAERQLNKDEFTQLFDALFPPAAEDASQNAKTRAENKRIEALKAARRSENRVDGPGNLATLWNAATFLVDRNDDGTFRKAKGDASPVESMLFGSRAARVNEIQTIIEVFLTDGTIKEMTQTEAADAGVPADQVGKAVLRDLGMEYD